MYVSSHFSHKFNEGQVKRKYLALFAKYKTIKKNNNSSGQDAKNFEYYAQLDAMHSRDANVLPVCPISSINPKPMKAAADKLQDEDIDVTSQPSTSQHSSDSIPSTSGST